MQVITWLGHGTWKMTTPQGTIVYLDPWIAKNPACPIGLDDIDRADLVCVTHGHSDHLGDAIEPRPPDGRDAGDHPRGGRLLQPSRHPL